MPSATKILKTILFPRHTRELSSSFTCSFEDVVATSKQENDDDLSSTLSNVVPGGSTASINAVVVVVAAAVGSQLLCPSSSSSSPPCTAYHAVVSPFVWHASEQGIHGHAPSTKNQKRKDRY